MELVKNKKNGILELLSKRISIDDIYQWIDKFIYWKVFQQKTFVWIIILFFSLNFIINVIPFNNGWDIDSPSFYTAARGIKEKINIYSEKEFQKLADSIFGKTIVVWPYIYPPLLAQIFIIFSTIHYENYFIFLLIINTILTFACLYLIYYLLDMKNKKTKIPIFFLFSFIYINIPLNIAIDFGQINFLVLLFILISLAFDKKDKQFISSFFLVMAILIKIYPALFIIYYIFKKRYKYVFYSLINSLVIILTSSIIFGIHYWIEFLNITLKSFIYGEKPLYFFDFNAFLNNSSPQAFLTQFFLCFNISRKFVTPALLILFALSLIIFWKKIKLFIKIEEQNFYSSVLLTLTLILSSMTWQHHYMVLMFPIAYFFMLIIDSKKYIYFIPLVLIYYTIFLYPLLSGFPFNQMRLLVTVCFLFLLFYFYISEKKQHHSTNLAM